MYHNFESELDEVRPVRFMMFFLFRFNAINLINVTVKIEKKIFIKYFLVTINSNLIP